MYARRLDLRGQGPDLIEIGDQSAKHLKGRRNHAISRVQSNHVFDVLDLGKCDGGIRHCAIHHLPGVIYASEWVALARFLR
jgi:uncharacterized circularly permuted ATP-grasp superfamily protein